MMRLKTILRHARLRYLVWSRLGWCYVCGRRTVFVVVDPKTIRENARCLWCKSTSRNRHVAKCVVERLRDHGARCMKDLPAINSLSIYNMSASGSFSRVWGKCDHIVCSEYFPGHKSGESVGGVLCENVEELSFPTACFDVVISEDVFEHVRDYRRGFEEVRRVLKPEGYHIFSIPFGFEQRTVSRFEDRNGAEVAVLPVEYHGDPVRGQIPVYTSFGYDLLDYLRGSGFRVSLDVSGRDEERKYGTFGSYTFVAQRV